VSRIARLTDGSRARSAGSSKDSDLTEYVRDDEVVREAGEGLIRGGLVQIGHVMTVCESISVVGRIGGHLGGCRVRVVVSRGSSRLPRKAFHQEFY
jgi:hypothetical protein